MWQNLWIRIRHEWDTTLAGLVIGPAITIGINVLEAESHSQTIPPWLAALCGAIVIVLGALAPSFSKTQRDSAQSLRSVTKAVLFILVAGSLSLVAREAQAKGFGAVCLSGCAAPQAAQASALQLAPEGKTPLPLLGAEWWLAPSIGATVSTYDGVTRTWTTGVLPVLAYSLYWKPASWTVTDSLLALGLSASAGVVTETGVFEARLEPVATLANYFTFGAGYRWAGNAHGAVYSLGLSLPTGSP
jgi:hypothetical protein